MHLRKVLTVGAAVLAAGLLSITPTATANNPTGGPIARVMVDGNLINGVTTFTGVFKSGTASFGGGTFGCTGGTVGGNITRGTGAGPMTFTGLNITCSTPLGIDATISIGANCATATWSDDNVHTGQNPAINVIDTGNTPKISNVDGSVTLGNNCGTVTAGPCTANVSGTVAAQYNEAIKTVNGVKYQDLILDGAGLTLANQSFFCFGLLAGGVTLNHIDFNINAAAGGIDFQN